MLLIDKVLFDSSHSHADNEKSMHNTRIMNSDKHSIAKQGKENDGNRVQCYDPRFEESCFMEGEDCIDPNANLNDVIEENFKNLVDRKKQ